MPSQIDSPVPTVVSSNSSTPHPLAPLSADEIKNAATLIRAFWPTNIDLLFKVITLEEPPKVEVIRFLEAEAKGETATFPARKASVAYYIRKTVSKVRVFQTTDVPLTCLFGG